jgi:hypothetical protein
MDTSEKYINMCKKSTVLQSVWKPETHDFVYNECSTCIGSIPEPYIGTYSGYPASPGWTRTYLFRQDELQDIMDNYLESYHTPYFWLVELSEWFVDPYGFGAYPLPKQLKKLDEWGKYICQFKSMEQLWLVYVHYNIYSNIWDSDKGYWVTVT